MHNNLNWRDLLSLTSITDSKRTQGKQDGGLNRPASIIKELNRAKAVAVEQDPQDREGSPRDKPAARLTLEEVPAGRFSLVNSFIKLESKR